MAIRMVRGRAVRVKTALPKIKDCSSCGACCMYQGRPPVVAIPMELPEAIRDELWAADIEVAQGLRKKPGRKLEKIAAGIRTEFADPEDIDPCWWLDLETKQCRHYEHRPQTCKDFKVGGRDCITTRHEFRIPLPLA